MYDAMVADVHCKMCALSWLRKHAGLGPHDQDSSVPNTL
jgi:hypothetical protein